MAYQTPITVKQALDRIHRNDYVLPAIQREFVWDPDQVCRLFDSLLRGYPIGTFLFWNVRADLVAEFQFYEVMREYHELKARHSPKLFLPEPRDLTAILDGQQRLSSLNIGLRGSYAAKLPRRRVDSPDAYPEKRLHLDLLFMPGEDDDIQYRFAFLSDEDLRRADPDTEHWYPAGAILEVPDAGHSIFQYIQDHRLQESRTAFGTLASLWTAVHQNPVISFFEEEEQSLSKVLDIFVRVNSGGTVLSKSDLLLSIATAEFRERDAREAIHGLVDDLNATPPGFQITKDLVLKAGLTLSGISELGFRVENFNRSNMEILDRGWDGIDRALRVAVKIIASFGFSGRTLSAASVIIPVADYVHHNDIDETWLNANVHAGERDALRRWIIRSLVKPGIWGSNLDGLLKTLHQTIRANPGRFPVTELEAAMARMGKSLTFDEELLEDIVDTPHRNKRIVPLLTLLYPGVDTRNEFHEDHIFPKSLFTEARLKREGFGLEQIEAMRARFDRLPNLQLLSGPVNTQKSATLPGEWIRQQYPDPVARDGWLASYDMTGLPPGLGGFLEFYDQRRARMLTRLRGLLASSATESHRIAGSSPWLHQESPSSTAIPSPQHRPHGGRPTTEEPTAPSRIHRPQSEWSARWEGTDSPDPYPSPPPRPIPAEPEGTRRSPVPFDEEALVGVPLTLSRKGIRATGRYTRSGFTVDAGSMVHRSVLPSLSESNWRRREEIRNSGAMQDDGEHLVLTRDVHFGSPSGAASVLLGSSINGRDEWFDARGRTINQLLSG